jgi:O-antigen/teichoic acid export membrane protein
MNNLTDVVGGELLLRAANAAVAVLIGRVYGAATLGLYAAILAAATLAERVADNGLELTGIAEVSRKPQYLGQIATALCLNKTVLSVIAVALLAGIGLLVDLSRAEWTIAVILTLRTFCYSYCRLNAGLLKALNKTNYIVRIQGAHFALLTICLVGIYIWRQGMTTLLVCLLAAQAFEFVAAYVALRSFGLRVQFISFRFCWEMLRRSTAVGATYTFSTLMLRGDVVVLSLVASVSEVGAFAAANTGLVMLYVIAWLFSGVLISDFGNLSSNRNLFECHFRKCLRLVLISSVPLAVAASSLARPTILLMFGNKFAAAALPGALMMLALPFIFLNATFLSHAIARSASRRSVGIYGGVAVLSLALNYLFARWYGASGVAGSIVIREAVITLLFVIFERPLDWAIRPGTGAESKPEFAALPNILENSSIAM